LRFKSQEKKEKEKRKFNKNKNFQATYVFKFHCLFQNFFIFSLTKIQKGLKIKNFN
jgi:hypothetical protein